MNFCQILKKKRSIKVRKDWTNKSRGGVIPIHIRHCGFVAFITRIFSGSDSTGDLSSKRKDDMQCKFCDQSLIFLSHSLRNLYKAEAPRNIRVKLLLDNVWMSDDSSSSSLLAPVMYV